MPLIDRSIYGWDMIDRRMLLFGTVGALGLGIALSADEASPDLRLRDNSPIGNDVWDDKGRILRDLSELFGRVVNIVFLGQSTNNNCVPGRLAVKNERNIFNLSLAHPMRSRIFQAKEPLLVSDVQEGHHGMDIADALLAGGYCDNVILTPVACGGSFVADYSPNGGISHADTRRAGVLSYRIGLAARSIAYARLSHIPTIVDWQQGEWDSDDVPTSHDHYKAALSSIISECKRVGLLRQGNVMFINQCTRPTNPATSREPIRLAQREVTDGDLILQGPDIDLISAEYRYDGTHFNRAGAARQAEMKLPGFVRYMEHAFANA